MGSGLRVLALDTSTLRQTVAAVEAGRVVAGRDGEVQKGHTGSLLQSIDGCLREAGWRPAEVELVAVGLGPGSFTGLRIGVAAAKTFCMALDKPVVGVDSLAAIAHGRRDGLVVTATDARKGEVYAAVWEVEKGWPEPVVAAAAYRPEVLVAQLAERDRSMLGLGNGFALYSAIFENGLGGRLTIGAEKEGWPRASSVAELGVRQLERGGPARLDALEPHYVRPSDAEIGTKGRPPGGSDVA